MKAEYIDQYGINSLPNLIVASRARCSHFITINKSMLQDREELEEKFHIKITTPEEALEEMKDETSDE